MSGSGISWAICKSASHSRQITTHYRPQGCLIDILANDADDDRMIREDTRTWREKGDACPSRNVTVDVTVGVSFYTVLCLNCYYHFCFSFKWLLSSLLQVGLCIPVNLLDLWNRFYILSPDQHCQNTRWFFCIVETVKYHCMTVVKTIDSSLTVLS